MKWLSYEGNRRRPWTEHNCFPKGAIKAWREHAYRSRCPLLIFMMSDDRRTITFVPEEDWDGYQRSAPSA